MVPLFFVMLEISIHNGNLLDIIKSNSTSSIRGIQNPHIIALSKFLFMDHDFNSFSDIFKFYKGNTSNIDIINFYFGLSYIAFEKKLDGELDQYNLEKEFNNLKFSDKNYKKVLNLIHSFTINPKLKSLNAINDLSLESDVILLSKAFCFRYSNLEVSNYNSFYPDLSKLFLSNKNHNLIISSFEDFNEFCDNNGLLCISFVTKFFNHFDSDTKALLLNTLFSKRIFDADILHKFLRLEFLDNNSLKDFLLILDTYNDFLDEKIILGCFHYIHLNSYLSNNYDPVISWYNKFTSKLNDGSLKTDFDDSIDWNLDDNNFEPVSYWSYQKNARFYLNSLPSLIQTRKNFNLIDSNLSTNKINIIGGSQALAWSNLCTDKYYIDISFHYTDKFILSNNSFVLNKKDLSFLAEDNSITIFNFDIEFLLEFDIDIFLKNIFSEIDSVTTFQNIVFLSIPMPALLSYPYLEYNKVIKAINEYNECLEKYKDLHHYTFINIDDYTDLIQPYGNLDLNIANNNVTYISPDNLFFHYYLKPDIISRLINSEVRDLINV